MILLSGIGWGYDGSEFTTPSVPAPTKDDLIASAVTNKTILINQANDYINSKQWPSRLALGRLSNEDKSTFNAWLDYLDALNAIDTSTAPDITWPEQPV